MSPRVFIFYIFLCTSVLATRTPQFPFLWFEDKFDSLQDTIWSKRVDDPYSGCWTVANGSLRVAAWDTPECYVRPELRFGAWKLPVAGRIYGASVRLEGGGIPKSACCAYQVQLGVNSLNYRREIYEPFGNGGSGIRCGSNLTQCVIDTCGGATGDFQEDWSLAGTFQGRYQRTVCTGDVCWCNNLDAPLRCTLPENNYTTNIVSSADGSQLTVTMLQSPGTWTVANSGILSLRGPNLTLASIGLQAAYQIEGRGDWFGGRTRFPDNIIVDTFQVYLAGQCYDNNIVSGDGCDNTTYVEPLCSCSRRSNLVWGLSQCSCARNATALRAFINMDAIHMRDLAGLVILGNYTEQVEIDETGLSTVSFSRCPIPNLGCGNPNTVRVLSAIINGTLVGNFSGAGFVALNLSPGRQEWTVNVSRFGAPFPVGTRVQFIWWTNTRYPAQAGALHLDGPAISATPTYVIRKAYPIVFSSGSSADVLGGFNFNVNFSSSIRDPSRIELWLYQGPITFSAASNYNFTEDYTVLTRLQANCSSAPVEGPVVHSCNVSVPVLNETKGFLVARVASNYIISPIMSTGIQAFKSPIVYVNDRPTAADSGTLEFTGIAFDERCLWAVTVNNTLIPSSLVMQNYSYVRLNLSAVMALDADIFATLDYLGVQVTYLVGKTYNTFARLQTNVNQKIYFDDVTIVITGSGFIAGYPQEHRILLRQIGVATAPVASVVDAQETNVTIKLASRLRSGGLSASLILLDGRKSPEVIIGFYYGYSAYDRVQLPSDIDLSVVPSISFTIGSPLLVDGPRNTTISRVENAVFSLTNISNGDIYTRLSFVRTSGTNYTLTIWFVTGRAVSAFNNFEVASNRSIIESINAAVLFGLHPSFSCNVSTSTEILDPSWPYLIFGLSQTASLRTRAPQTQELQDIISFLQTLWRLSASSDLTVVSRPGSEGNFFDLYIYFRTASAQAYFMQSRLPFNETIPPAESLITDALAAEFAAKFISGSEVPELERQISPSWPWIRFLLQPTGVLPLILPTSVSSQLSVASASQIRLGQSEIFLRVSSTPTTKRNVGDYDMFIYFTTPGAVAALNAQSIPTNDSLLSNLVQMVSNVTEGSYNATFIGTNLPAPSATAVNDQAPISAPIWQISVGVAAAVVLFAAIIIVAIIFYRRRFRALQNAKRAAAELPAEMAGMFSIPASEIQILDKLGEGSFGAVFSAKWKGQTVAVKKLGSNLLSSQVADFFREFSLMAGLKAHRNVVRVYGMSQEVGNFSMVMELLRGGSLDSLVQKRSISPWNQFENVELYSLARGIALGMRHLAACGIVHRDLAARNILLDAHNTPKVADFGLSRVVGDNFKGKTATTIGPIRWMAPENISKLEYSEKSDVWAYGALLIELITGGEPFPSLDLMNVATEVRDGRTTALSYISIDTTAPSWILELIQLCFTFDEKERPSFNEVVGFLTSHAPSGFVFDPNEEDPDHLTDEQTDEIGGVAGGGRRKRGRSRKASNAPKAGTKYADMHSGGGGSSSTSVELQTLSKK